MADKSVGVSVSLLFCPSSAPPPSRPPPVDGWGASARPHSVFLRPLFSSPNHSYLPVCMHVTGREFSAARVLYAIFISVLLPPSLLLILFLLAPSCVQVTEEQLRAIFNTAIIAAVPGSNLPGMEPFLSFHLHHDGMSAIMELRTPEMATAVMQLSGQMTLHGRPMHIVRPAAELHQSGQVNAARIQVLGRQQEQRRMCAQSHLQTPAGAGSSEKMSSQKDARAATGVARSRHGATRAQSWQVMMSAQSQLQTPDGAGSSSKQTASQKEVRAAARGVYTGGHLASHEVGRVS